MKKVLAIFAAVMMMMSSCSKSSDNTTAGNCTTRNTCTVTFKNDYSSALDIKVYDQDKKLKLTITGLAAGASITKDTVPAGPVNIIWSGGTLSGSLSHFPTYESCKSYTENYYTTLPSDMRYKKDVSAIESSVALAGLMQLKPASYKYDFTRFPQLPVNIKGKTNGFIAQNVEQVFPEVVIKDAAGYRSVNYAAFIPVLTAALQQQQQQIQILEKEINMLKHPR